MGFRGVTVRQILELAPTAMISAAIELSPSYAPPAPPPPPAYVNSNRSGAQASLKPSIAVIIGVLTTMFSLTFLLLLYAKHCKRTPTIGPDEGFPASRSMLQTDLGINRSVVEGLPMFTFGSLQGMKDGLECAVCLSKFEQNDILRLLPKCRHAFHLPCVDTWLVSHSTCPLCRHFITAEDNFAVDELVLSQRPLTPEEAVYEAGIAAGGPRSSTHDALSMECCTSGRLSLSQAPSEGDYAKGAGEVITRKDGLLLGGGDVYGGETIGQHGAWGFLRKSFESSISPIHKAVSRHFRRPPALQRSQSPDHGGGLRRVGHRIVVADVVMQHRWSDFVPSDVLFLHANTIFGPEEKARVSVSRNEFPTASPASSRIQRRDSTGGDSCAHDVSVPSKKSTAGKAATARAQQDLELGLPSGKPSKAIKLDSDSRAWAIWSGGESERLKHSILVDDFGSDEARSSAPRTIQRSLSETAGLERVAMVGRGHGRVSARANLWGPRSPRSCGTTDQEETSKKWFSIARKTLNWIMGGRREKKDWNAGYS